MVTDHLLRAIIDTAIDGFILIDEAGVVVLFNPACEKLFGYRPDEVIGRNVTLLMPEPYRSEHDGYLRHHLETGEKRIIGIGREVLGRRKDGSLFPFELAVGEHRQGDTSVFVGVIHDLTQRRASEAGLRESEARFRLLVDSIPDYAIFMLDAEGRVVTWNAGAQKLTGYTPEEAIGKRRDQYYTDADRQSGQPDAALRIARETGRYVNAEWRRHKDGHRFWVNVEISAIRGESGALTGYVNVTRDMTALRQTEELQEQLRQAQKMEAIGQLTGGVAHDFNNLLAVIVGNLELLEDRLEEGEDRRLAQQALRNAVRGAELTQRLLAFGRRQKLKPSRLDANALIAGMEEMMRRSLGEMVQIEILPADGLPEIDADGSQLENAILNIALNARDAMPGGGRLIISTVLQIVYEPRPVGDRTVPPGSYVTIAIRDTGSGMPPDVKARIFEPFFTTKDIGKGSGLGLSMVYGFVQQSGGMIEVDSEPGAGTEFRLLLPVPGAAISEEEAPLRCVLCVEDNPDVRAMTAALIKTLGYAVLTAASGPEALAILQRPVPVDLLLTDMMMPGGMGGLALAERAAELRPALPVLFMSGSLGDDALRGTRFAGRARVLPKPVRKTVLSEALIELLGDAVQR
jgi:PAS domain S-box-containing protein